MITLDNIKQMVANGTLCPYAFNTYELGPQGRQRFCCVWKEQALLDEDGNQLTVNNSTIQDAWDSTQLNQIRADMLDSKQVKGCERCYHEEQSSSASLRLQESHRILEVPEDTAYFVDTINEFTNTGKVKHIRRMDLRLASLCNIACVMCTPDISTTSAREAKKILDKDQRFAEFTNYKPIFENEVDFGLDQKYMQDVQDNIHHVNKIFFIGGEPSVMRSIPILLQYCIDQDIAKNIEVQFSINVTNLAQRSVELLSHFKSVQLTLSIDGVGKVNEYIRYPSKWDKIMANLEILMDLPEPFWFSTAPVPMIYNVLHWHELMQFWDSINKNLMIGRQIYVGPCDLVDPPFLKFQNLTPALRPLAIERLKQCFDLEMYNTNDTISEKTKYMISELENNTFNEDYYNQMVQYSQILDKHRNLNMHECIPELTDILYS